MYSRFEKRMLHRVTSGMIVLTGVFWLISSGSVHGQDDSPLMKKFLTEAPKAWKQQQAFCSTLEGNNRTEQKSRKGGGKWQSKPGRIAWKLCNDNILDQFEFFESGSWNGTVIAANSEYSFSLKRDSDTKRL
jgi:hypothetical protein